MDVFFRGSALNAVDAKGRLSVPAFIRQKIERRSDEKLLVLNRHDSLPCLIGYASSLSEDMWAEAERLRLREEDKADVDPLAAFDRLSGGFGGALEVPYDPSGRIILPPRLKKRGAIEDHALFVGMGDRFTIWNPKRALESGSRQLRELTEDLLEEKGITL